MLNLVSNFGWENNNIVQSSFHLKNSHLSFCMKDIRTLLNHYAGRYSDTIKKRLSELDDLRFLRILEAPETQYNLYLACHDSDPLFYIKYLNASIDTEQGICSRDGMTWSAAADFSIDKNGNKVDSPQLLKNTVIDFDSPYANRPIKGTTIDELENFWKEENVSNSIRNTCLSKLRESTKAIESVSSIVANFVSASLRNIIVRENPFYNMRYSSFSNSNYIGRTYLINLHCAHISAADVASSLIHESIHSYMYKLDRLMPLLTDVSDAPGIESPWTGKELHLSTYVHACFVWYGLYMFWQLPGVEKYFSTEGVEYNRSLSYRGFRKYDSLKRLSHVRANINDRVFREILHAWNDVSEDSDKSFYSLLAKFN